MPLHDYKCTRCGNIFEKIVDWNEYSTSCPNCGDISTREYNSFNGIKHTAPDWMKSTLEVVDKDGGPHCQEFLKHPNRDNYNNWMKKEGLRPFEPGESMKHTKKDTSGIRKKVKENFRKRDTIELRSGT